MADFKNKEKVCGVLTQSRSQKSSELKSTPVTENLNAPSIDELSVDKLSPIQSPIPSSEQIQNVETGTSLITTEQTTYNLRERLIRTKSKPNYFKNINFKEFVQKKSREKLSCEFCPEIKTVSENKLIQHYYAKHEKIVREREKKFFCNICEDKNFATKFMSEIHLNNTHTLAGQEAFCCKICESRFHSQAILSAHTRRMHRALIVITLKCREDKCKRQFEFETLRGIHEKKFHKDLFNHKCITCEVMYVGEDYLKTHEKTHSEYNPTEEEGRYLTCLVCKIQFLEKRILAQHLLTHTGEAKLQCKDCPEKFLFLKELNEHLREKHNVENPNKCPICHETFGFWNERLSCIQKHLDALQEITVKEECVVVGFQNESESCTTKWIRKPGKSHKGSEKCLFCQMRFSNKNKLKIHKQRNHAASKVYIYVCRMCQWATHQQRKFRNHLKAHNGRVRYICYICQSEFYHKSNLQFHFNNHKKQNKHKSFVTPVVLPKSPSMENNIESISIKQENEEIYTELNLETPSNEEIQICYEDTDRTIELEYIEPDTNKVLTPSIQFLGSFLPGIIYKDLTSFREQNDSQIKIEGLETTEMDCEEEGAEPVDLVMSDKVLAKDGPPPNASGGQSSEKYVDKPTIDIKIKKIENTQDMVLCLWKIDKLCSPTLNIKLFAESVLNTHSDKGSFFKCPICIQRFVKKVEFEIHMDIHIVKKRFTCLICKIWFTNLRLLNKHLENHRKNGTSSYSLTPLLSNQS